MDTHLKRRIILYSILLVASLAGFFYQFVLPMISAGRSPPSAA